MKNIGVGEDFVAHSGRVGGGRGEDDLFPWIMLGCLENSGCGAALEEGLGGRACY